MAALVIRHFAQRQLTQRRQIARLEKILERRLDPFRRIDFSFAQTLAQLFYRNVDGYDLIGP